MWPEGGFTKDGASVRQLTATLSHAVLLFSSLSKGDRLTMRSCPDTVGGKIISRAVREEEREHSGGEVHHDLGNKRR